MKDKYNLTRGHILEQLILVSIPVMATAFVQMFYNMTDLFFLGQVGRDSVASAGFGGLFMWLGAAVFILVKIGTEVRVSQQVGKGMYDEAKEFARTGIQLEFIFALTYALFLFLLSPYLMSFFGIESAVVYNDAVMYLRILSFGVIFYSLNPIFSASLNGTGNTLSPFIISATGLFINVVLDYVFIILLGFGIQGAAIATVIAQSFVTVLFLVYFKLFDSILTKARYFGKISKEKAKNILSLGAPVAIQSALFTFIAMVISRLVTQYGAELGVESSANAVQKIGAQIESLSWLVAGGLSTALSAFVGQNFGALKYDRLKRGIRYALITMTVYGVFISFVLFIAAEPLFKLFLPNEVDKAAIPIGVSYLRIMAFSQLAMIIEGLIGGAFNGLGKTIPQSIVSIFFNALRIPLAIIFFSIWSLDGVWIAISLTSVFKGAVIFIWFKIYSKRKIDTCIEQEELLNDLNDDKMVLN